MSSQRSPTPTRTAANQTTPRKVAVDANPNTPTAEATNKPFAGRKVVKSRTYSARDFPVELLEGYKKPGSRRASHDTPGSEPLRYIFNVDQTLRDLLAQEDTDHNIQITVDDKGPKTIRAGTAGSGGYRHIDLRGTYVLSNLLQELTLAKKANLTQLEIGDDLLHENPVERFARRINESFWPNLTRRIDGSNIAEVARDTKVKDPRPRIYVPRGAPEQYEYYQRIAAEHPGMQLDVRWLAANPGDDEYVRDLNEAPGLLAIEMERIEDTPDGKPNFRGLPFVVPGGRFNELYGWDSYMETLGLLINGRTELGESMVKHFCFCIQHYGKILNANRTYYLCRSQPPFLTDMALRVYDHIRHRPGALDFLRKAILAAIKDYYATWMSKPRYDPESGLSRYVPGGLGVPPETEATHFKHILTPYADKHNMTFEEFVQAYNYRRVQEPELDEYFLHDRSVRESGHDTSYRLEKVSAHLATVDLNSLLYKIESDIARTISAFFGDSLDIPPEWHVAGQPTVERSSTWDRRARKRRRIMGDLMWDENAGMFFDYNTVKKEQTGYESATTFWAMWAGAATPRQANIMVQKALPRFEVYGGLVSGTQESRGAVGLHRPNRQWDYPFGWAPQQILAWTGLIRYNFEEDAQRLAYRWIYMCTKAFYEFNGVVVEKYNVTSTESPHKVAAEYGNQGADFKGVATEGFGWVNASYIYGLEIVNNQMRRTLGALADWDTFNKMTQATTPKEAAKILRKATKEEKDIVTVHVAEHVRRTATTLPHSHEDTVGHAAVHGAGERKEHRGPGEVTAHA